MAVETSNGDNRQDRYESSDVNPTAHSTTDSGDIEQYGVWVKAGPVDIGDDEDNTTEFKMEDLESGSADGTLTQEEEELLGSLESEEQTQLDASQEDFDVDSLPEIGDSDELTIENFDLSPEDQSSYNVEEHDLDEEESESLDDIGGFELDLPDSNEEEESMGIPEESASILQKIERDLLSIKDELTALKNEITSLRGGGSKLEAEDQREEAESGFFEEDEDETIALTGDELDNILNTADITEQTGQSTVLPEDNDLLMEEEEAEGESIIDRDDILLEEEPLETETMDLDEGDLSLDESLADIASVTEEPTEELSLEVETPSGEEDLLDLPEEEEIVLEDLGEAEDLGAAEDLDLAEVTAESAEVAEFETEEKGAAEETTFELDEELDLSQNEMNDLEESQDLLGGEELVDLPESALDDVELAEVESEAREDAEQAPPEAEETLDEAFDLTDGELEPLEAEPVEEISAERAPTNLPDDLKSEIRAILKYMDQLLESLPEEKIEEFANSEYFDVYKRLFEELGLTT